jgi:benzoylformate decarboxylase
MTQMTGQKAMMELLLQAGVEYVFGIPGATEILFMDALEKAPRINYILGLNEIVCAGMAEGYARASGKPGFLNLHTGPGLAAALGMLYNAQAGGVPLVVTVGQNHTRLLQYEPHLSGDIVGMGKLYTKWCTEIVHAQDIPAVMQRAFKMAMQPPTGPVLVSIPQNVLADPLECEIQPATVVYPQVRPDPEALRVAVAIIKQARRPFLLVESGVARSGALDEVVRLAEQIGARVYQSWMSDVNFPVNHPQYLGDLDPTSPAAKNILESADVLIGIGCPMFGQGFFNPDSTLPKGLKIVQIDDNPWEIGKNLPVACGIQADIRTALSELNQLLAETFSDSARQAANARAQEIGRLKQGIVERLEQQIAAERFNVPISIACLMDAIKSVADSDTLIVDDCWSSSAMLRQVLDLSRAGSFFRSRRGGSIGWGLPGALGVKLGQPGKKVIAVCGDGSAAWSMQSLWTAAHYRIPVTFVITNNATYRQVKLVRKMVLGDYPLSERHTGMELDDPVIDFCKLAGSMGVSGFKVTKPGELGQVLQNATRAAGPNLIEVLVENKSD